MFEVVCLKTGRAERFPDMEYAMIWASMLLRDRRPYRLDILTTNPKEVTHEKGNQGVTDEAGREA